MYATRNHGSAYNCYFDFGSRFNYYICSDDEMMGGKVMLKLFYGWGVVSFALLFSMAMGMFLGHLDLKYRNKVLNALSVVILVLIVTSIFLF